MHILLPHRVKARGVHLDIGSGSGGLLRLDRVRLGSDITLHVPEGIRACVVDVFPQEGRKHTYILSLVVAPRAEVTVVSVIPSYCRSPVCITQRGKVEAGGKIHWWNATCGGQNVQHDLVSEVVGDSGESAVDWVFLARDRQHYDLRVQNVFRAPHGKGEVTVKGVASDHAHAGCHGAIVIGKGGSGTNTHLTQHALMLDASAKVDAVPALEIKTNDVKASHSATVTKVSEEDLFYMGSRGLGRDEARRMYVEGFLKEVIARIPLESLQEEVCKNLGL